MLTPLIKDVKILENYMLLLFFENGEKKVYDMKKNFKYPVFEKLKNINLFSKLKVNGETIEWETGEDINPDDLYFNSIKYEDYKKEIIRLKTELFLLRVLYLLMLQSGFLQVHI